MSKATLKNSKRLPLNASLIFVIGFFTTAPLSAHAQSPTIRSCYSVKGGAVRWDYCVYKPTQSKGQDVLYYLHGLEGSDTEWSELPHYDDVYQSWGANAPTVVTISYGGIWLLAEKNGSGYSGLYENFLNTALPFIEKTNNLTPSRRLLVGLSMGGFNAAQLYLKNPNLFARVALLCPAITTVGPYSSQTEINAYVARTHALWTNVRNALEVSSTYFPNESAWENADPISLASKQGNSTFPPLFVSGGLQDQYGFFEGAAYFASEVVSQGAQAIWDPVNGGHCSFDWQATANFIVAH